jgi:hypothetical protein
MMWNARALTASRLPTGPGFDTVEQAECGGLPEPAVRATFDQPPGGVPLSEGGGVGQRCAAGDDRAVGIDVGAGVEEGVEDAHELGKQDGPYYVRLRGSDGRRTASGLRGAAVDPAGPKVDALGNADPWQDLWFYTNPIFVLPKAK